MNFCFNITTFVFNFINPWMFCLYCENNSNFSLSLSTNPHFPIIADKTEIFSQISCRLSKFFIIPFSILIHLLQSFQKFPSTFKDLPNRKCFTSTKKGFENMWATHLTKKKKILHPYLSWQYRSEFQ